MSHPLSCSGAREEMLEEDHEQLHGPELGAAAGKVLAVPGSRGCGRGELRPRLLGPRLRMLSSRPGLQGAPWRPSARMDLGWTRRARQMAVGWVGFKPERDLSLSGI